MSAAQLHLGLNHFPIFATLFGLGLLVWGLWRRQDVQKRLALLFFVIAAVSATPVYLSGEPAEEMIEHRAGVSEAIIHAHEEAAEVAFITVGILGAMSALMLFLAHRGKNVGGVLWTGLLLVGTLALIFFLRAAHLGGQIRHDELRGNAVALAASPGASGVFLALRFSKRSFQSEPRRSSRP